MKDNIRKLEEDIKAQKAEISKIKSDQADQIKSIEQEYGEKKKNILRR